MCGILCALGEICCSKCLKIKHVEKILIEKLGHRGPNGHHSIGIKNNFILCHTRLSIVGYDNGAQPIKWIDPKNNNHIIYLSVNGEIYNYKDLYSKYCSNAKLSTNSDSEVILHLYNQFKTDEKQLNKMLLHLNGMFAFILLDVTKINNDKYKISILFARDCIGIKPLYSGYNSNHNSYWISSELKAISSICDKVQHIKGGHYIYNKDINMQSIKNDIFIPKRFYSPIYYQNYIKNKSFDYFLPINNINEIYSKIKTLLIKSVKLRMMRDEDKVNIGVFLSGGLDSSLVAAIAAKYTNKLYLFAVGMKDGIDVIAARTVAEYLIKNNKYCKFIYKEKIFEKDDLIKNDYFMIKNMVYTIESFEETITGSGIGNIYLAKLAQKHNVRVILTGGGADELFGGYNYLQSEYYSNDLLFQNEMIYSIQTLQQIGLLRGDKCGMKYGIEQRVPFLDTNVIDYVMRINPKYKKTEKGGIKKNLLRNSFKNDNLIPIDILFRKKLQFSGGLGQTLYEIFQELGNNKIFDYELRNAKQMFPTKTPKNKTQIFLRKVFEQYFGQQNIDCVITWGNEQKDENDNKYKMFQQDLKQQQKTQTHHQSKL
eukprot:69051_1